MFLVIIDAHSKWIEVFPMSNATALHGSEFLIPLYRTMVLSLLLKSFRTSANRTEFSTSDHLPTIHRQMDWLKEPSQVFKQGMKKASSGTGSDSV